MKTPRNSVPKSIRFEVLKRDKFTCQYCGGTAPQVVLHVDHIHPASKGGADEMVNLITSCQPCNSGKSNRTIDDESVLGRQRAQLKEMQSRREQLEMMMAWRSSLDDLQGAAAVELVKHWAKHSGYSVADVESLGYPQEDRLYPGMCSDAKLWLKTHALGELMDAVEVAIKQYKNESIVVGNSRIPKAWAWAIKIAKHRKRSESVPGFDRLFYVRGILRNRFRLSQREQQEALRIGQQALRSGVDIEDVDMLARGVASFQLWVDEVAKLVTV